MAKKRASVRGEKRFRPKRPRPIKVKVGEPSLREVAGISITIHPGPADPVVPLETQDPPPLRDRGRDHLWRVPE